METDAIYFVITHFLWLRGYNKQHYIIKFIQLGLPA